MAIKGKIPPELLQKIKDAVNLVEVVGEHVVLRKSGSNHSGLCPFHSERSPSFSVSEQKQLYHCYGCKKGGDLVSFVMELHGLSFPEAIEELAERARIALPRDWSGPDGNDDPETAKRKAAAREKLSLAHKLNRFVAAYYHQLVPRQPHIHEYFKSRGVDGDEARSFYVGAAPPSWDALAHHLVAKKAPLELAVELGLIRPSQKGKSGGPGYFDLFRNRAMFPILDLRGKVAGFGGRKLPLPEGAPDVGGEDSPKYMNSPESLIFHKNKLAFGLFQAQKHVREKDEVILVEGYFDVLALHAAGFRNVVATCGTSLTPEHLQLFRRFCGRITVLFDGDRAGISATERAMEIGLDHGLVLYGTMIPDGLDPDEVLFDQATGKPTPDGAERMKGILGAAKPLLDNSIDQQLVAARQGPEARTQALKQIGVWLSRFRDPIGRDVRLQAVQTQLGVSPQLLQKAMAEGAAKEGRRGGAPIAVPASSQGPNSGPNPGPRPVQPSGPTSSPGRPPQPRPSAGPAEPTRSAKPRGKLTRRDRVLLAALARGGIYSGIFAEIRGKLPPEATISDLFDYPPAREFTAGLFQDASALERFRVTPDDFLKDDLDPQVRSTLTEALVASELTFEIEEVRNALGRSARDAWARFSQQIKVRLLEAEAKQDTELRQKLNEEYLDVQRKMKEFSSFI